MQVWDHWGDPCRIAKSDWHWQKMTSRKRPKNGRDGGRELLRGWRRPIGLIVSFMIFTASGQYILARPSLIVGNLLHGVS
jgi:hypothetical protein